MRFPNLGRQPEDLDIWTHSNETLATVRRRILSRIKAANQIASLSSAVGASGTVIQPQTGGQQHSGGQLQNQQQQQQSSTVKLDLYLNNELIDPSEGYRLISELPLRDKTVPKPLTCYGLLPLFIHFFLRIL